MANFSSNNNPKGTGFVNLSSILNANRNNRLGATLNQGVSGVVNNANDSFSKANNEFSGAIKDEETRRTDATNQENQILGKLDNSNPNGTSDNPLGFSDDDYRNYAGIRNYQYKGPDGLDSNLIQSANDAQTVGGLTRSIGGRGELLRRFVGGDNYNKTHQTLDSLYLGPDGASTLRQAGRGSENIASKVGRAVEDSRVQVGENQRQANELAQNAVKAISDKSGSLNSDLQNRLNAARTDYTGSIGRFKSDITGKTLTPEERQQLGLPSYNSDFGTESKSARLYGIDPLSNRYYTESLAPTVDSVANRLDLAKANALAKLGGTDQTLISDPNQVGTYSKPYQINQEALTRDIADSKSNFLNDLNKIHYQYYPGTPTQAGSDPTVGLLDALKLAQRDYQGARNPQTWENERNMGRYSPDREQAALQQSQQKLSEIQGLIEQYYQNQFGKNGSI